MQPYHKINAPFKRHMSGPDKGKLIVGDWAMPELAYLADNQWEFTEKVDGTNIRVKSFNNDAGCVVSFGGRTDKAVIPKPLLTYLNNTFEADRVAVWMQSAGLELVTLYGEGYGPDIQGGGKYRQDPSFVLFDVCIGDFWLKREDVNDIASKLGIDSVPVLGTGTLWSAIDIVRSGLDSAWGEFTAEGIIAVPTVPMFTRMGDRIITKVKSKDFI